MYIIILNSLDNLGVKPIFFFFCSSECSAWSCLYTLVQLDLTADKMNLRGSKKVAEDGRPHSLTDNCRNRYTGLYANEKRGLYYTHTHTHKFFKPFLRTLQLRINYTVTSCYVYNIIHFLVLWPHQTQWVVALHSLMRHEQVPSINVTVWTHSLYAVWETVAVLLKQMRNRP